MIKSSEMGFGPTRGGSAGSDGDPPCPIPCPAAYREPELLRAYGRPNARLHCAPPMRSDSIPPIPAPPPPRPVARREPDFGEYSIVGLMEGKARKVVREEISPRARLCGPVVRQRGEPSDQEERHASPFARPGRSPPRLQREPSRPPPPRPAPVADPPAPYLPASERARRGGAALGGTGGWTEVTPRAAFLLSVDC
eukprot:Hpha_TRINITY_DN32598_c0_g1::TRINITY_DN32598_c0_g1_i1::g.24427::m.24427